MQIKVISFISLIYLCISCQSTDKEGINIDNIKIIGHGGSGFQSQNVVYPANSFSSIKNALEGIGCDGVEIDIQISKDSIFFSYHEENLESYTNGIGKIALQESDYIKTCAFRNSSTLNTELILNLEQIIFYYSKFKNKPYLFLNFHYYRNQIDGYIFPKLFPIVSRQIINIINKSGFKEKIFFESLESDLLDQIRQRDTTIQLLWDTDEITRLLVDISISKKYNGIVCDQNFTDSKIVNYAHQNQLLIGLYGLKLRNQIIKGINSKPDFIQVDNLVLAAEILQP